MSGGDAYLYEPTISRRDAEPSSFGPRARVFCALVGDEIVGTSMVRPNAPGLGDHVANAGYMVAARARRRGVGRALCVHSLIAARRAGFLAMQFNQVVATNTSAIDVWKRCGFRIVGTVPGGFRAADGRFADLLIMHRFLRRGSATGRVVPG